MDLEITCKNKQSSKLGLWKDDKIVSLTDLTKEELIAKVEELSDTLKEIYENENLLYKQPNAETLQSFEDAKNKVGLTTCKDLEEFWKDINQEIDK